MDYAESRRRIIAALDSRPLTWLAARLGYANRDYVSRMLSGREPSPPTLYEDIAALLHVQPRDIKPTEMVVTFARPGSRRQRAVAT